MGDPVVLKPYRDQAWVAHIDPPLFLNIINHVFMPEGGRND